MLVNSTSKQLEKRGSLISMNAVGQFCKTRKLTISVKFSSDYFYAISNFIIGIKGWKLKGEQFEAVATVILRVPGYFILDYWYQHDLRNCIPRSLAWADIVSSGFAIFGELTASL